MNTEPAQGKTSIGQFLLALFLAFIVGSGTALLLAWPGLMKQQYSSVVRWDSVKDIEIGACVCAYNKPFNMRSIINSLYVLHQPIGNICGLTSILISSAEPGTVVTRHEPMPPRSLPLPPNIVPAAECSSFKMIALFILAALVGVASGMAFYSRFSLWMRTRRASRKLA
jgi:hypothetical protein